MKLVGIHRYLMKEGIQRLWFVGLVSGVGLMLGGCGDPQEGAIAVLHEAGI